jgi:ribosomal protein L37E
MATPLSMRRQWEIALHEWEHGYESTHKTKPSSQESHEELERICNRIGPDSDELQDYQCAHCEWGTVSKKFTPPKPEQVQQVAALAQLELLAS